MELLRKESGVIELILQGSKYGYSPFIQTDYSYELILDPIVNKPAFVLRSETQIIFSAEDYILFKSYAMYIFDYVEGEYITGNDLWKVTVDGRRSMDIILHSKLIALPAIKQISLPTLDYTTEISTLEQLVVAGLRLN